MPAMSDTRAFIRLSTRAWLRWLFRQQGKTVALKDVPDEKLYRAWAGKLSVTMRQTHLGGDKLFVDYAGDNVPVIVDRLTGEIRQAQIFVGDGRLQLQLRGGDLEARSGRLDRRSYPALSRRSTAFPI
jgi:hypothetical protein